MLPLGEKRLPVKLGEISHPILEESEFYPSHQGIDFITAINKILHCSQKWD